MGLIRNCYLAQAKVVGVGIVIEKAFQHGRACIEKEGVKVESLAIIESLKGNEVI